MRGISPLFVYLQAPYEMPFFTSIKLGCFVSHTFILKSHLVENLHPLGGFKRLGSSPFIMEKDFLIDGSGIGIESISILVYGWRGFSKSLSTSASSTISPMYITAILSLMYLMTDRSWDMNRYVKFLDFLRSFKWIDCMMLDG